MGVEEKEEQGKGRRKERRRGEDQEKDHKPTTKGTYYLPKLSEPTPDELGFTSVGPI